MDNTLDMERLSPRILTSEDIDTAEKVRKLYDENPEVISLEQLAREYSASDYNDLSKSFSENGMDPEGPEGKKLDKMTEIRFVFSERFAQSEGNYLETTFGKKPENLDPESDPWSDAGLKLRDLALEYFSGNESVADEGGPLSVWYKETGESLNRTPGIEWENFVEGFKNDTPWKGSERANKKKEELKEWGYRLLEKIASHEEDLIPDRPTFREMRKPKKKEPKKVDPGEVPVDEWVDNITSASDSPQGVVFGLDRDEATATPTVAELPEEKVKDAGTKPVEESEEDKLTRQMWEAEIASEDARMENIQPDDADAYGRARERKEKLLKDGPEAFRLRAREKLAEGKEIIDTSGAAGTGTDATVKSEEKDKVEIIPEHLSYDKRDKFKAARNNLTDAIENYKLAAGYVQDPKKEGKSVFGPAYKGFYDEKGLYVQREDQFKIAWREFKESTEGLRKSLRNQKVMINGKEVTMGVLESRINSALSERQSVGDLVDDDLKNAVAGKLLLIKTYNAGLRSYLKEKDMSMVKKTYGERRPEWGSPEAAPTGRGLLGIAEALDEGRRSERERGGRERGSEAPEKSSIEWFLEEKNPDNRRVVKELNMRDETIYGFYRFQDRRDGKVRVYSFTLDDLGDGKGRKPRYRGHKYFEVDSREALPDELRKRMEQLKAEGKIKDWAYEKKFTQDDFENMLRDAEKIPWEPRDDAKGGKGRDKSRGRRTSR